MAERVGQWPPRHVGANSVPPPNPRKTLMDRSRKRSTLSVLPWTMDTLCSHSSQCHHLHHLNYCYHPLSGDLCLTL